MQRANFTPTSWFFAVVYTVLSLAVEIVLLVVGRLQIPRDNALIAPVVLTLPPMLAAWIFGYRRPKAFFLLAGLTAALTLGITILFGRFTGISTGLAEPILVRSAAGFLAMVLARRVAPPPAPR